MLLFRITKRSTLNTRTSKQKNDEYRLSYESTRISPGNIGTALVVCQQRKQPRRLHRTGALRSLHTTDSSELLMRTSLSEPVNNSHRVVIEPLSASTLVCLSVCLSVSVHIAVDIFCLFCLAITSSHTWGCSSVLLVFDVKRRDTALDLARYTLAINPTAWQLIFSG